MSYNTIFQVYPKIIYLTWKFLLNNRTQIRLRLLSENIL